MLIFCIGIANIPVEGTVSQNFEKRPCSFFIKSRKKYSKKLYKIYPFFDIK